MNSFHAYRAIVFYVFCGLLLVGSSKLSFANESVGVQSEPIQVEPIQLEPIQAEPIQAEPIQAEPIQVEPIQVFTEATPLTLHHPNLEQGGEATIFVNEVLRRAKIDYQTTFIPWKRSYQYALHQPNVLIYPIARTAQREEEFIWLGRLVPVHYFLFRLRSRGDIQLENLDDAKQYTIGVVNNHVHHEYLISKGFTDLQRVNNSTQNLRKLLLGRIDLFPLSVGGLQPLCDTQKIDCTELVPAITLEKFSQGLYMAFSRDSQSDIIKAVRNAYKEVIEEEEYQELFSSRLNALELFLAQ